jgi:hypothetical protein
VATNLILLRNETCPSEKREELKREEHSSSLFIFMVTPFVSVSDLLSQFLRSLKKNQKKYLTTFLKNAIKLKNFNLIVLFFHKLRKKGGDDRDLGNGKSLQYFKKEVKHWGIKE